MESGMIGRLIVCGTVAALLAAPAGAAAQAKPEAPAPPELAAKSLEELMSIEVQSVVGAAKHEQRVTEAPSSVTIVTAADIRTFGWRTMADVLRSVRGFYVTDDRNYSYLGVRGFGRPTDYNNRVLVLIDGHRLNDNVYDGALIGTEFPVDLDLVDRIEVIRGPGSALYGTSAFFAVVNVITRRGGAIGGGEVAAGAGTQHTYQARGTAGRAWTGGDLLVSATRMQRRGYADLYFPAFDSPETGAGHAIDMDRDESSSMFLNARAGQVMLQGAFSTRTKLVPTAAWDTQFGNPRFETTDRRAWLDASYSRTVGGTLVTGRAYVDHMGYEGAYPYPDDVMNMDSSEGTWMGGEVTGARRLGSRNRLIVGIEQRANLRQAQDNWDVPGEVYVHDDRSTNQGALFVQDEITLSRRWTATLGARWDWWTLGSGSVRPRAGLVYRTDSDLAVKLLYGEAFRAANVYELFYWEPSSQGNPNLRPELLRTSEVVFEQYIRGRVRFTATGFVTHIEDLIDQTESENGGVIHVNRGSAGAHGVETEAEYRSARGVLVRGSLVAQRATDRDTDADLSNAPERLATFQGALPLLNREMTVALDSTFVGRRRTREGRELDAFWLSNLVTTWQPRGASFMLQGTIANLFDRTYEHPVGTEIVPDTVTQNGRTASIRLSVRF